MEERGTWKILTGKDIVFIGMGIQKELGEFKRRLDVEVGTYLDGVIQDVRKEDVFLAELLSRVKVFVLSGGKRLRGALLYYGYKLSGGGDDREILNACVGIELVHNFFLVHDDIMDRDDKRHGVNTLHREFSDLGGRFFPGKDSEHFGISMAITAGDLLGSMGSQKIFSLKFPADRIVRALSVLQGSISRTGLGQAMDVYMGYSGQATERSVLTMYQNKTARYTFECPLYLGGILAGANEKTLELFSRYALPLGIAFQLRDDILGVFGDTRRTGKSSGSDISEGKMTLLLVKALELGTQEDRKELLSYIGREDISTEIIQRVREILKNSGAFSYVQQLEEKYLQEGLSFAQEFPDECPEAKGFLVGVAEFLKERGI